MFSEQRDHQRIAGLVMLESARDSLIDAMSLGKLSLVSAAVAEAKEILSIPGETKPKASSHVGDAEDAAAKPLLALTDSLLQRLSSGRLLMAIGQPVAVGVSLFPGKLFSELALPVGSPWKCAVIAGNTDIGRAFACYAITADLAATLDSLEDFNRTTGGFYPARISGTVGWADDHELVTVTYAPVVICQQDRRGNGVSVR